MGIHNSTDQIRRRAHEIWLEEGRPADSGLRHWLQAEAELVRARRPLVPFKGFSVLGERTGRPAETKEGR